VKCGLYDKNPNLCNCVTLELPEELGVSNSCEQMKGLLFATAEAWEPDWAGVMSRESMHRDGFSAERPFVDWMVYISRSMLRSVPAVMPPSEVQSVGQIG
jgi:hypothetical protein